MTPIDHDEYDLAIARLDEAERLLHRAWVLVDDRSEVAREIQEFLDA